MTAGGKTIAWRSIRFFAVLALGLLAVWSGFLTQTRGRFFGDAVTTKAKSSHSTVDKFQHPGNNAVTTNNITIFTNSSRENTRTANSTINRSGNKNNTKANTTTEPKALADKSTRIVASFKTIPSRIQHIEPTLTSLLDHQTMPLDKLYIVLPRTKWIFKKEETLTYEIPSFLSNLAKTDPRFTILRPEYDYGPIDKMLYAIQEESDDSVSSVSTTKLIYLDDDVIYHKDLVRTLVDKSVEYPDSVVALSGCTLKSNFRQISHNFPRGRYDKHPNLYYPLSGTQSLPEDEVVDIVQGFAGVLIQPSFFDIPYFLELVRAVTRHHDIWKADDYIVSGYLATLNITRRLVVGHVVPEINKKCATKDNVATHMYRQVMQAAFELRRRLGIWIEHDFVDYLSLDSYWKDLIDCEAGHSAHCQKAANSARNPNVVANGIANGHAAKPKRAVTRGEATTLLDAYLLTRAR